MNAEATRAALLDFMQAATVAEALAEYHPDRFGVLVDSDVYRDLKTAAFEASDRIHLSGDDLRALSAESAGSLLDGWSASLRYVLRRLDEALYGKEIGE